MIEMLNKSQQRWLAISLLLAVILLFATAIMWPILEKNYQYQSAIDEIIFRIRRYNKVIAIQDQIFNQVDKTRKQIAEQGYISDKETEALVSAELQKFIKDTVADAGGKLTSTQVLPSKDDGELTRIAVKIRMSGTMEMLRSLLYAIESAKPLLIVNQIDINPQRGRRNRKTKKIEPTDQLNINLMVISFMRKTS